ncbi:MAG: RNA polymerase sigma factor [Planctomycetota bacterium]
MAQSATEPALDPAKALLEFRRSGSADAFSALFTRFAPMVYAICRRRLNSSADAEDATQAVFLALFRHARKVHPDHLPGWLHRAAVNAAAVVLRARARRAAHEQEAARMNQLKHAHASHAHSEHGRSEHDLSEHDQWAELRPHLDAGIDALPGKLREIVVRQYVLGQSRPAIARALGLPEGTVQSRARAGLERLRRFLPAHGAALSGALLMKGMAADTALMPASVAASAPHVLSLAVGGAHGAGAASSSVSVIAKGVSNMFLVSQMKIAAVLVCALVLSGTLTAVAVHSATARSAQVPSVLSAPPAPPAPPAQQAQQAAAPTQPTAPQADPLALPAGIDSDTVVSQIHNAPDWQAATAYKPGDRVVILTTQPARAFQCVQAGTSGTKAPDSTGAAVKDGSVTWKYLSDVDYTSLTAWLYDAPRWKPGTTYRYHAYVTFGTPLCSYRCGLVGAGPSTEDPTDPTYRDDAGNGYDEINPRDFAKRHVKTGPDGYLWRKVATIGYSSGKSFIPTVLYPANSTDFRKAEVQMKKSYAAELWNDREYVAGENGENHPIFLNDHQGWHPGDACPQGVDGKNRLIITAAPGESFMDRPNAPLHYDPAQGVAIRNPAGGIGAWGWSPGNGLLFSDAYDTLDRLQIKSATGHVTGEIGGNAPNGLLLTNDLLESDAGGKVDALECDCMGVMVNCLLIGAGPKGVYPKYPMRIDHCTVVSTQPAADSIGVMSGIPWDIKGVEKGAVLRGCLIFGWKNPVASEQYWGKWEDGKNWNEPDGGNNATDQDDPGEHLFPDGKLKTHPLPGNVNHYKVVFDKTLFRDPGQDWRLVATSPLKDLGMSRDHPAEVKFDAKGNITQYGVK